MNSEIVEEFLRELAREMPGDERLSLHAVQGDPNAARGWPMEAWRVGLGDPQMPRGANNYVCVSSFRRPLEGGKWNRQKSNWGRGLAMMVDDVGTKVGTPSLVPTARIETSPGNEQWWYFLSEAETDLYTFEASIAAWVAKFAPGGSDPGMKGANRIGRLPCGVNAKEKYRDAATGKLWQVRCLEWRPDIRYTLKEWRRGMGWLVIPAPRIRLTGGGASPLHNWEVSQRREEFYAMVEDAERAGMFIEEHWGQNGRRAILCPRASEHTGKAGGGSYLTEPCAENYWRGSFICFHSTTHNDACHLRDIARVVEVAESERLAELLEAANTETFGS